MGLSGKARTRCRPRWDTHLNSRSLLNWNSILAATAAKRVKKCRNGQVKTIWLPFSGSSCKILVGIITHEISLNSCSLCSINLILYRLFTFLQYSDRNLNKTIILKFLHVYSDNATQKLKSSLYSPYYAEACNEWRGPSSWLSAWAIHRVTISCLFLSLCLFSKAMSYKT